MLASMLDITIRTTVNGWVVVDARKIGEMGDEYVAETIEKVLQIVEMLLEKKAQKPPMYYAKGGVDVGDGKTS